MPIKGKTLLHYVPHGINQEVFRPFDKTEKNLVEGKKRFFNGATYDYSIFFNSRNVKRKQVSNVLLAFRIFCDSLSPEEAKRVCLILHTEAVGQNGHGTDLIAVKEAICKNYTVFFSQKKITPGEMNLMYNLSDVTINVSSNEGFGLSVGESIMAGTPIIVNVTGGLQDQCGFTLDGKLLEAEDYVKIGSLHEWRKWEKTVKFGEWATPISTNQT